MLCVAVLFWVTGPLTPEFGKARLTFNQVVDSEGVEIDNHPLHVVLSDTVLLSFAEM